MLGIDGRAARATWTVALMLLFFWLLYAIRETILVFVIALLFAYLLLPLVDFLDRRLPLKASRGPALAITYVTLVTVMILLGTEIGTRVAEQATLLAQRIPELLKPDRAVPLPEPIRPVGEKLITAAREYIQEHSQELLSSASKLGMRAAGAAGSLIYIVIIPVLSFFFLKDGRSVLAALLMGVSADHRDVVRDIAADVNLLLAQYMRALVLLGLASSVSYGLFFLLMGVPYPLLLAAIAFPLEFLPMVGPLTSSVIILGVAGFSGYPHLLAIVVFLVAFRLFQDYVLQPHLLSSGMELHPLLVIFGVFAGEQVAGIPGAFLSVPILATLRIVYRRITAPGRAELSRR
ncbi:MAG: AI-2E family transporter [Bryobacteraceae bacterium]